MPESTQHTALVNVILHHIHHQYAQTVALGVVTDLPSHLGAEKPNRIGGFVPDVYAFDAPQTTVIIGEAKTYVDLETPHSHRQISAFLSFLVHQDVGVFILAVPWRAKRRAHAIVTMLRDGVGARSVQTITLDDLGL